ncbi:MAG: 4-hydroxythreonine-4-phosphate dehydrogenase PdxA [Planctomycetia bacterium]|nr:4-hydroxythreonine-4-phosphate dehydrogenase PdxA [Planctomycetia bacterium]
MPQPLVALTLGDPAGIGPEVILGAWQHPQVHQWCRPFVVGHPEILRRAATLLGHNVKVHEIATPEEAAPTLGVVPCLTACRDDAVDVPPARIDARGGQTAYDALVAAARLALDGRVDAITTAPLHKAALWQAGHHYPGHTELLAELCGVDDFAMMLYLGPNEQVRGAAGLGVVHVTLHVALRDALAALTTEGVLAKIRLADTAMRRLVDRAPRIGVCALNPHGGESGLFGREESTTIEPAVQAARAAGLDASGPYPADALMARARDGAFDAVVAMYHDQGHIALKLLGMHRAVNVTLGLPIIRTSVAHGTAFDIAWQGRARPTSMIEAIRVASELARRGVPRRQLSTTSPST